MRHLLLRIFPTLLILALLLRSEVARADEPQPIHRYADDRLPPPAAKVKLFFTGVAVTAGFYLPALGASYAWPDSPGAKDLRIPLAGPWMSVGRTRLCKNDPNAPDTCQDAMRIVGAIVTVLDGLGQAGGLFLMVDSLFMRTARIDGAVGMDRYRSPYYNPQVAFTQMAEPRRPLTFKQGDFEVTPAPFSSAEVDWGLSLTGKF